MMLPLLRKVGCPIGETKESYDTSSGNVDGMAIIKIDIWNTFDETKDKWVNELHN